MDFSKTQWPSLFALFLLLWFGSGCATQKPLLVSSESGQVAYMGRIGQQGEQAKELYWSGTSVKIRFEGTTAQAELRDETGKNYYNVIVDGGEPQVLRPDTTRRTYTLASGLPAGEHTVELFKRTEFDRGKTWFYGFVLPAGGQVLPSPAAPQRKIVFYGNSITAGYAIDDLSGKDRSDSVFTNNYKSYATLTARHFNADYHCICKSGIGIMISWFPYTMPDLYDRLDPADPQSKWDFAQDQPDVVVINLFQNDSWLVLQPERAEFKTNFGTAPPTEEQIVRAYQNFVRTIRAKYPQAHLIAMLGNMDITRPGSPWPGYVEQAVAGLNDPRLYTHFEPFKNSPGHPNEAEQKQLAAGLIRVIGEKVGWK